MAGGDECKNIAVRGSVQLGYSKKKGCKEVVDRKKQEQAKAQENKYGAWGSTYKNKEHFTNMHLC